jgi:hypothetical protein
MNVLIDGFGWLKGFKMDALLLSHMSSTPPTAGPRK